MDSPNTIRTEPPRFPPPAATDRSGPAPTRYALHITLLAATAVTTCVSGAWFWIESFRDVGDLAADPSLVLAGMPYAIWLLVILGAHEMGHYLACRRYGIPATLPFFIPGIPPFGTFGAVIRIRGIVPDRRALFDVAAAGPLAGFLVGLPILIVGLHQSLPMTAVPAAGETWMGQPLLSGLLAPLIFPAMESFRPSPLYGAAWVGMLVTSMNLFPVGQLDGGHAAYAVSARLHRVLAQLTLVLLFALVVFQALVLRTIPAYALWLVILLFMRDRHPRLADESVPLDRGRKAIALLLAAIFVATFTPLPFLFF